MDFQQLIRPVDHRGIVAKEETAKKGHGGGQH